MPDPRFSQRSSDFSIFAVQIRGTEAKAWQDRFFHPTPTCNTQVPSRIVSLTIGGRLVRRGDVEHAGTLVLSEYEYAVGDTLFGVLSPPGTMTLATQALELLP